MDVLYNGASGSGATALDWHAALGADSPFADLHGTQTKVSGSLDELNIADLVSGSADFSVSKQLVDVDLPDVQGADLVGAELLGITLSDLHLSVGTADVGLQVTSGSIAVGILSAAPSTTAGVTDTRGWLGIAAHDLGGSLGVGTALQATLSDVDLLVGRASGSYVEAGVTTLATPIDWSQIDEAPADLADVTGACSSSAARSTGSRSPTSSPAARTSRSRGGSSTSAR